jgi:hypothetical protein
VRHIKPDHPVKPVVERYLHIVRELIPTEGRSDERIGGKKCPDPEHARIIEEFLRRLEGRLNRLFAEPPAECRHLMGYRAKFSPDKDEKGKYHHICIALLELFGHLDRQNVICFWIEGILSNRKLQNVYVGLRWSIAPVKEEKFTPVFAHLLHGVSAISLS